MTVLITGGTGFVVAHVARLLMQELDITILDINPFRSGPGLDQVWTWKRESLSMTTLSSGRNCSTAPRKVFSELMGQFYRRKFDLDFRDVRYPSIVGPGVKNPGVVQYSCSPRPG